MANLALLGGEKTLSKQREDYTVHPIPESAYGVVEDLMRKDEISHAPIIYEFEENFAKYIGRKHALCEVNGTTSIQAALFAVGVGAGDEVIVPSYTFWASAGPIVACNASPVFADVDADTFQLSAKTIEAAITPKTKAVVLVHVWGTPCDMDSILEVCKKHGLKLVEDCSHAHGAKYKGKRVGSFGDVGCFSLQGSKLLSAGEGGVLVCDSDEYFERALALGQYNRLNQLEDSSEYKKYFKTGFGFKHRAHPLGIAIANEALKTLDSLNETRTEMGEYLNSLISSVDCIAPQKTPDGGEKVFAYHYMRYFPEKFHGIALSTVLKAFAAEGVVCGSCGYGTLHREPLYTEKVMCGLSCPCRDGEFKTPEKLENTELLAKTTFLIAPRFEKATKEDIELYAKAILKVFANADELIEYEKVNSVTEIKNEGRSINIFK